MKAHPNDLSLFNRATVAKRIETSKNPLPPLRDFLKEGVEILKQRFLAGTPAA